MMRRMQFCFVVAVLACIFLHSEIDAGTPPSTIKPTTIPPATMAPTTTTVRAPVGGTGSGSVPAPGGGGSGAVGLAASVFVITMGCLAAGYRL